MATEPFWLKPKKIKLKDGTVVTLRPEEEKDLEPVWVMFSTLSDESLQHLPIPITRERVEGWFREINYERALPILGLVEEKGGKGYRGLQPRFQSNGVQQACNHVRDNGSR